MLLRTSRTLLTISTFFVAAAFVYGDTGVWIGGVGGWGDETKWSPFGVPPNGADVFIDGGDTGSASYVTIGGGGVDVGSLNIDAGDTLNVIQGGTLSSRGAVVNYGTLLLNSNDASNIARFNIISPDNTLTGAGELVFVTPYDNRIDCTYSYNLLTLGSGQTVKTLPGATGSISAPITNNGTIDADGGIITFGGFYKKNQNVIKACNGGAIGVSTTIDNAAGSFTAESNSALTIDASGNVQGGAVNVQNGGSMYLQNSGTATNTILTVSTGGILNLRSTGGSYGNFFGGTLTGSGTITAAYGQLGNGAILDAGSTIHIPSNGILALQHTTTNLGEIRLEDDSTERGAYLVVQDEDSALNGNGKILFTTPYDNCISYTFAWQMLTLGPEQTMATLPGARGTISAPITNKGTIDADGGTITLNGVSKVNQSVIKARNGGAIIVFATIDNAAGSLTAESGSTVTVNAEGNVQGGTLSVQNGGAMYLQNDGTITDATLTVDAGGSLDFRSTGGPYGNFFGGTLTGPGTITASSGQLGSGTTLDAGSTIHIPSGGTLALLQTTTNLGEIRLEADSTAGSAYLRVQDEASTLNGNGKILFTTPYDNFIDYIFSWQMLTLGPEQTIATLPGATGTISAPLTNKGTVDANGGVITFNAGYKVNQSVMKARNGGSIIVSTTIDNTTGSLTAESGSIVTIDKYSNLQGGMVNVQNGGAVYLQNSGTTTDATLTVNAGGSLDFSSSGGFFGGLLTGPGTITTASGQLGNGATLDAGSTIHVPGGDCILSVLNTTTNLGEIRLEDDNASGGAYLYVGNENSTLNGNGKILFATPYNNSIVWSFGWQTLTLGTEQTLATLPGATGTISSHLTNNGTIDADGGTISMDSMQKTNNGLMRARHDGTILAPSVPLTNYDSVSRTLTGGQWTAESDGTIDFGPSNSIAINAAQITLSSAAARFDALHALAKNEGIFRVSLEHSFSTLSDLENTGTLIVEQSAHFIVNGTLNGTGDTTVLDNSTLQANGIFQEMLSIGANSIVTIQPLSAMPPGGHVKTVPEPATWLLLILALWCLKRRYR